MAKTNKLSILLNGIIKENPVLVLVLGTCPTLAVTTQTVNAFGMGAAATAVLLFSNVAISLLRKVIVVVPLTVLLPRIPAIGVMGVFLAEPISNVIGGAASYLTMLKVTGRIFRQKENRTLSCAVYVGVIYLPG